MSDEIEVMEQKNEVLVLSRSDELNGIGAGFFGKGQIEPAKLHFLAALSLEPNHALALQNLGAVLRALGHHKASESVARRAVVASNGSPFCWSNLGVAQLALRQYGKALTTLRSVVDDLPGYGPSWHNLGLVQYMMGDYHLALKTFDKAMALSPENLQIQSDRALTLLALGKIQQGLEAYEVRWKLLGRSPAWREDVPQWQGEDLQGKTILVHHEQGFGDTIMLLRFLQSVWDLGAAITVAVPRELKRLCLQNFGFCAVVAFDEIERIDHLAFDYHCPMLSLMRWLRIDAPADIDCRPYIVSDPAGIMKLPGAKTKIGICWASGNHAPEMAERRRVVDLTSFLPLVELPDVALVSLQKGPESKDIGACGMEGMVYDVSSRLEDFAATAAVISQLDFVITVDSAVAHLAGAMGVRTLVLSPYTRCWRWWGFHSGMPWYSGMEMAFQNEDGGWTSAMEMALTYARENVAQ
jgi:tetratricopeptide (TPR) repeat protein